MKTKTFNPAAALLVVFAVLIMGCPTPDSVGGNNGQTPTADDFEISGTGEFPYDGNVKTVTITPKDGKTTGAITVKYGSSTTAPSAPTGAYTVTFDVAAASGWNPVRGLAAGTLTIYIDNVAKLSDFLSRQPANTKTTPYNIALNIKEAGFADMPMTLNRWTDKYVSFNLSWSTITRIPDNAFNTGSPSYTGCPTLAGITIGNSVTAIGSNAFRDCAGLTGITIPNSVTVIGDGAFRRTNFTGITIPNSVTVIGESAFHECASLARITIPNSVTVIGDHAFNGCTGLTGVSIGNSVETIGQFAFNGCIKLTGVTIPNSVTSIGGRAFYWCTSLTGVTIGNSVASIGFGAFANTDITGVTIPKSVNSIEQYAFLSCAKLTSVTIPDSVAIIGEKAFYSCTRLASVTFQGPIHTDNFNPDEPFMGDLRTKFYSVNSFTGTPGTYTTAKPGWEAVWTLKKQ